MSADPPQKRKPASKRDPVSPKKPPKKRSNSPTAENLEALLHLLDDGVALESGLPAELKNQAPAAGRTPKPPNEKTPPPAGAHSFMQELARARADLHKERRSRIALAEEIESLRRELFQVAAKGSPKLDALSRECEGLQKQLAALERQRRKLQDARLDLESQLEAEQQQREQLIDQTDALSRRLAAERSQRESIAAELDTTRRELECRTVEADAARTDGQAACDELRAELASMTSRCEQAVQARDAAQAAAAQQQSEVAALTERLADAETKTREREELIEQARSAANESARQANEWEERFEHERATRTKIEQQYSERVKEHGITTGTLATRVEALRVEAVALREQLAEASNKLAALAVDEQQLRTELSEAKHEKRKTAVSLEATAAANERLERRVHELETELAANNQQLAERQNDSEVVNSRIERLEAKVAKGRIDLAAAYEQLGAARLRLANTDRDREQAQQREAETQRRASELADEVAALQASVQREAAARRKAETVQKREAGDDEASALFEAEQKIERLTAELIASKGVEAAYQQKAARKVQQFKQELETLRQRLGEINQRPKGN